MLWLQEAVREVADDREEEAAGGGGDAPEPIPLVPLTEETDNAVDNTRFQALLRKLGAKPPANEQVRPVTMWMRSVPLKVKVTAT